MNKNKQINIFISHFGKDDQHVQNLKQRLISNGYNIRNSSIDSTKHKDGRVPKKEVVERLLRRHISWSSKFICLIGDKTHTRPWVDYEIKEAHLQGKDIIGIFKHGCNNSVEVPENFEKYGQALLGWNSIDKLGQILLGNILPFENPDSTLHLPIHQIPRVQC